MLTDDDLTRQLGGAFEEASADLRYAGRVPAAHHAPSPAWLAVPALATVATVAALAVTSGPGPDGVAPAPEAGITGPSAPSTTAAPELVTDTITVAGFTYTYRHAPGAELADDLYADLSPAPRPDDATPVAGAPKGVKAWVGTDTESGHHALWVQAPTRNGGKLFLLLSPTWTEDQLSDLFLNGQPRVVPAVD